MSLFTASINSGSNGNCYYIGNKDEAILVDAGISCKETVLRMERIGLQIDKVKAIFISHEHIDHISGVNMLSKKYNLPVYITAQTLNGSGLKLRSDLAFSFTAGQAVQIGGLSVTGFTKNHDAADPHSFIISHQDLHVGVFTDIGFACKEVIQYFRKCHAAFLETNYDEDMLMNGHYPEVLKKRISGRKGHLSNAQALKLMLSEKPDHMTHLFLSHLSRENNRPELVYNLFAPYAGKTKVIVAHRDKETELYSIVNLVRRQLSLF